MGHVEDRWTKPGPNGRRIKSERHGRGARWLAVWDQPDGRRKRAFTSKDGALQHLQEVELQVASGTWTTGGDLTLKAWAEHWQAQQIHLRPASMRTIVSRLSTVIADLGEYRLEQITPQLVQATVLRWNDRLQPQTVQHYHRSLRQVLDAAVDARRIPRNPAAKSNLPRLTDSKVEPLTVTQVWAVQEHVHSRYRGLAVLAAATGMRSSELTGLTVDRLKPNGAGAGSVKVDRQLASGVPSWGPPKSPAGYRTIAIDQQSWEALRTHLETYAAHSSGLVFTNKYGRPISKATMIQAWPDNIGKGWHDLRHFHASMLIAAGLSVTAVASRLGHDKPSVTLDVYGHLWHNDEDRAVQAVATHLWPGLRDVSAPTQPPEVQHRRSEG